MSLWKRLRTSVLTANRQRLNQFRRRFSTPFTPTLVDISELTALAHSFASTPSLNEIDKLFQLGNEEGAFSSLREAGSSTDSILTTQLTAPVGSFIIDADQLEQLSGNVSRPDCFTLLIGTPDPRELLWKAHCKLDGKVVDAEELAAISQHSQLYFAELPSNKELIKSIFESANLKHLFSNINKLSVALRKLTIAEVYFVVCLLESSMPVTLKKLTLAIDFEDKCLTSLEGRQKFQQKEIYKWINEQNSKFNKGRECPVKMENPLKKLLAKIVSLPGLKELSLYLANSNLSSLYIGNMDNDLLVKDSLSSFCFFSPDLTVRVASTLKEQLFSSDAVFGTQNNSSTPSLVEIGLGARAPFLPGLIDRNQASLFTYLFVNITCVQSLYFSAFTRLTTVKLALNKEGISWRTVLTALANLPLLTIFSFNPLEVAISNWPYSNTSSALIPLPKLPSVALFAVTYTQANGGHARVDPLRMFQIKQVFPNLKRFVFKVSILTCDCGYKSMKPAKESEKRKCAKAINKKVVKPLKKKFAGIVCKVEIKFGDENLLYDWESTGQYEKLEKLIKKK